MKCKGNRKSKKQKLSTKYNIAKRVREHKRRVKKEAKKLGIQKRVRKDPGIPNSWPYKAEMLADLERQKEKKDQEMEKKRARAKRRAKNEQKKASEEHRKEIEEREIERRKKRSEVAEKSQRDAFKRTLLKADVLLEVLDARDPLRCRCAGLETWAQEKGKRVVFVLSKTDLVAPQFVAQWIQFLGQVAPTVAVQAEAGREGLPELLQVLGHASSSSGSGAAAAPPAVVQPAIAVGVAGYPGVGKKSLLKNLKREIQGQSRWLLESIARLQPATGVLDAATSLHLAIRGMPLQTPAGATPAWSSVDPLEISKQLIDRAGQQAVMRRYRAPGFENADAFLKLFAKEKSIVGKKGKEAELAAIAKEFLADVTAGHGCVSVLSPEASGSGAGAVALWQAHTADMARIKALMEVQYTTLNERAAGPAATALAFPSSASFGPAVDVVQLLEADDADAAGDDDDMDDSEDDGEEGAEEGEEEEEGVESEEEDAAM